MSKHQYNLYFDPACRTLLAIDGPGRGRPGGLAIRIERTGPVGCEPLTFEPGRPLRPPQLRNSWMSVRIDVLAELAVADADSPLWRAVDPFSQPADPTQRGDAHIRQLEKLLSGRMGAALTTLGFDMTSGVHVTRHTPHELILIAGRPAHCKPTGTKTRGTGHVWL